MIPYKMVRNQEQTVLNSISAATSRNEIITIDEDVELGTIIVTTDSTYNGTTGTITLQGSLDNTNYTTVFQDDDTTAISFTLAASGNYTTLLKRVLFKYYKVVYTKGDASLGTISARFLGKKF